MGLARQIRRLRKKLERRTARKRRRKVLFETLEPRILLSADLKLAMTDTVNDLTLRLEDGSGTDTLKLIDNTDQ